MKKKQFSTPTVLGEWTNNYDCVYALHVYASYCAISHIFVAVFIAGLESTLDWVTHAHKLSQPLITPDTVLYCIAPSTALFSVVSLASVYLVYYRSDHTKSDRSAFGCDYDSDYWNQPYTPGLHKRPRKTVRLRNYFRDHKYRLRRWNLSETVIYELFSDHKTLAVSVTVTVSISLTESTNMNCLQRPGLLCHVPPWFMVHLRLRVVSTYSTRPLARCMLSLDGDGG